MMSMVLLFLIACQLIAAVVVHHVKLEDSNAYALKVFLPEQYKANLPLPILVFAVGTSFNADNYDTMGESYANNGVVLAIFDYGKSSMFKSDAQYEKNLPLALAQLYNATRFWNVDYSIDIDTSENGLFLGGHSAGGKATVNYLQKHPMQLAGVSLWDPVAGFRMNPPFHFTCNVLISYPVRSGCRLQINEGNNGAYFYKHSEPQQNVRLVPYLAPIAHNSISSSGAIGQRLCHKNVPGFIESYVTESTPFITSRGQF